MYKAYTLAACNKIALVFRQMPEGSDEYTTIAAIVPSMYEPRRTYTHFRARRQYILAGVLSGYMLKALPGTL